MKLNYLIIRLLLSTVLITGIIFASMAQPGDPSADPDVPITGIEILLAIGGGLGVRKIFAMRKRHE